MMNDLLTFRAVQADAASCHPAEHLGINKLIFIFRSLRNIIHLLVCDKDRTGPILDAIAVYRRTVIFFPIQDPTDISSGVFLI